jgi:hypothetical protein
MAGKLEKLSTPPCLDTTWSPRLIFTQELRKKLEAKAKRGAIVIVDPNNGDILRCFLAELRPELFIPSISAEKFKALQDDPISVAAAGISPVLSAGVDI